MKKVNISIFLVIIFCAVLRVDAQNYLLSTVAPADATFFNVDPADKTQHFLNIARTKIIDIETNLNYTAVSSESWCTAKVITQDTKKVLELAVQENAGSASRSAVVSLKVKDGYSCEINVNQMGKGSNILANKNSIEIYHYNLDFSIEISSNVEFIFTLPNWIKTTDTPALGFKEYKFSADPINETEGEKKGNIIIKSVGDVVPEITIPVTLTHIGYPRFAVISDVHFGNGKGDGPKVKVPKALKSLTSRGPLDAIFIVGDLTDGGTPAQYTQLVEVFSNKDNFTNKVDTVIYMLGNHDNYADKNNYVNGLKPLNGGKAYPYDQYIVIKGYPFITISQRASPNSDAISSMPTATSSYPKEVVEQLDAWLAQAAEECPGKPIFVFTHVPPRYGCYGAWPSEGNGVGSSWSMWPLNPVLNKYPQVVIFAGHSHFPIGDPRSIHQGVDPNSAKKNFYTSINTGSTTYSEVHNPAVSEGIHPKYYDNVTEGMILTAQSNGDVKIQRYDTYYNTEILPDKPWVLKAPHDGSAFAYADTRDKNDANPKNLTLRNGLPAPVFASGDIVTIDNYSTNSVTLTFPQATDDEYVFRYKVSIKNQDASVAKEVFQFSYFYLYSKMPETISVTINGLTSGKTYTAEVIAYDSFDNMSTAIVSQEFTTGAYTPAPGSTKPAASSLLLDVVFNVDGTATDASSLNNTITTGATVPTTYMNTTYNLQTAKFPKNTATFYKVDYKNNTTIKDAFSNGFTFETLYMVNSTSSTMSPMSAQESGGAGFEQTSAGVLQFWVRMGSSWVTINSSTTIQTGKYYHVVASYDKTTQKTYIYINGALEKELSATGTFSFPSNENAQWIAIGGDASTGATCQAALDGEVVVARMYNKAVTRDEIYWMYKDYDLETPEEPETPEAPTLKGAWLFDDANDLLKATEGAALVPGTETTGGTVTIVNSAAEAGITSIVGPSASNKAIKLPKAGLLKLVHNLNPTGAETAKTVDSYTIMYDVRIDSNSGTYHSLLQTATANNKDADFFMKNKQIGLSSSGWGYGSTTLSIDTWYRIVMVVDKGVPTSYINGVLERAGTAANDRWKLESIAALLFADNSGEDSDIDVAEIKLWKGALSANEVAALGNIK